MREANKKYMFDLSKECIDGLISGFLSKSATPEEQELLLKWIESDANNLKYYQQLYSMWLCSAQLHHPDPAQEEGALKRLHKKVFELSVADKRLQEKKAQKSIFSRSIFKYAVAIAGLIIATYSITHYTIKEQYEALVNEMTYEAHYGSRAFATLPDGSKVWLNSGSKLSVLEGFNIDERIVQLSGEAYFKVATNPEKPFVVKVDELTIRATGTAFNVKAYPEEEQITTTLVEGTVFLEGINREKEFKIKMAKNQSISYKRKIEIVEDKEAVGTEENLTSIPATITQDKVEVVTSWLKDRWIIDNEDFGSLAIQLERRYNVEIRFNSEELKQYRFTGTIERETVEQMFDAFRYSIPLQYAINKGIVTLTMDKALEKQYEKAWRQ